jgi:hypothetical protein
MYFDKNQVNDILLCQQCRGRSEGPKILPCGETICSFCVSSIKLLRINMFECLVCKQKHEMPKNGLPDNKVVLKMVSIKPIKVFRGEAVDSFEKSLDEILNKNRLIKHIIENSNDLVKEHCFDLRSDVQLKTEEAIQQINDMSTKIIERIDEYEQNLIKFNKNNSEALKVYNYIPKDLEMFHNVKIKYLKQNQIDEKIVIKSNEEAIGLIKKADLDIQNLKNIIFDTSLFTFEKSEETIKESVLGAIKMDNTSSLYIQLNIILEKEFYNNMGNSGLYDSSKVEYTKQLKRVKKSTTILDLMKQLGLQFFIFINLVLKLIFLFV